MGPKCTQARCATSCVEEFLHAITLRASIHAITRMIHAGYAATRTRDAVASTPSRTHVLRHTRSAAMRRVSRQRAQTLKLSSRQVHGRSRSISLSPQHAHSACAPTASNHGFEHGNPLTGVDRSFSVAFEQRRNRGRRGGNAMLLANGTRDSQLVLRGWRTGPATPALRRRCQRPRGHAKPHAGPIVF